MRAFYQTQWLDIQFSSFAELSSTIFAGHEFYDAFYRAVFKKYANYASLPADWLHNKNEISDWLAVTIPDGSNVLSVGCGLGYMKQRLWQHHAKRIDLHVYDYASESSRWLKQVIPAENIHNAGGGIKLKLENMTLFIFRRLIMLWQITNWLCYCHN